MFQITYLREEHRKGFDNYKVSFITMTFSPVTIESLNCLRSFEHLQKLTCYATIKMCLKSLLHWESNRSFRL